MATAPASTVKAWNFIPCEGEDGKFTQSWFPICLSSDVAPGSFQGYDFLDGKVIVVRSRDGKARVQSALCPHLGADLACGEMQGDDIRCAFHHWKYDETGVCTETGIGSDAPPKAAKLFNFPTVEKWGIVFAFNGETPHYELPDFVHDESKLKYKVKCVPTIDADPWVVCANTPDWQHIRTMHGIKILSDETPDKVVRWNDANFLYDFDGEFWNGESVHWNVGIYGTSLFFQQGYIQGKWMGVQAFMGMPRPNRSRVYFLVAVLDEGGAEQGFLKQAVKMECDILSQDMNVLNRMDYRQGKVTKQDKLLVTFLDFIRSYPRAHPSADYIR